MPEIAKVLSLTERIEVLEEQVGRQQFLLEVLEKRIKFIEAKEVKNERSTARAATGTIRRTEGCE